MAEKQQLLNFVFSNLKLDGKKLLVTLREPFLTLCAMSHQPANLHYPPNLEKRWQRLRLSQKQSISDKGQTIGLLDD